MDVKIRDLGAFEAAVKALGGEYIKTETRIRWYGRFLNDWNSQRAAVNRIDSKRFGTSDAGIARFPGCSYDVGLLKNEDGSYTPYYDTYGQGHGLTKVLGGESCINLKNEYAAAVTTRMLARKGFRFTRTTDAKTGEIKILARN